MALTVPYSFAAGVLKALFAGNVAVQVALDHLSKFDLIHRAYSVSFTNI